MRVVRVMRVLRVMCVLLVHVPRVMRVLVSCVCQCHACATCHACAAWCVSASLMRVAACHLRVCYVFMRVLRGVLNAVFRTKLLMMMSQLTHNVLRCQLTY